jgi:hypothetical protein
MAGESARFLDSWNLSPCQANQLVTFPLLFMAVSKHHMPRIHAEGWVESARKASARILRISELRNLLLLPGQPQGEAAERKGWRKKFSAISILIPPMVGPNYHGRLLGQAHGME